MTAVIVKNNNGAVSSVLTDSSVVKVFVLDEDPLNGAPGVSPGDRVYAFDALVQGIPTVSQERVVALIPELARALSAIEFESEASKVQAMLGKPGEVASSGSALRKGPFPYRLLVGEDPGCGDVKIGFIHEGVFVFDPLRSECGRFAVEPSEHGLIRAEAEYLNALNVLLDEATEDAINAGCLRIQRGLGEVDGGFAGVFFSGNDKRAEVARVLARYLLEQRAFMD